MLEGGLRAHDQACDCDMAAGETGQLSRLGCRKRVAGPHEAMPLVAGRWRSVECRMSSVETWI